MTIIPRPPLAGSGGGVETTVAHAGDAGFGWMNDYTGSLTFTRIADLVYLSGNVTYLGAFSSYNEVCHIPEEWRPVAAVSSIQIADPDGDPALVVLSALEAGNGSGNFDLHALTDDPAEVDGTVRISTFWEVAPA